jgi:hypothetical protein
MSRYDVRRHSMAAGEDSEALRACNSALGMNGPSGAGVARLSGARVMGLFRNEWGERAGLSS